MEIKKNRDEKTIFSFRVVVIRFNDKYFVIRFISYNLLVLANVLDADSKNFCFHTLIFLPSVEVITFFGVFWEKREKQF